MRVTAQLLGLSFELQRPEKKGDQGSLAWNRRMMNASHTLLLYLPHLPYQLMHSIF